MNGSDMTSHGVAAAAVVVGNYAIGSLLHFAPPPPEVAQGEQLLAGWGIALLAAWLASKSVKSVLTKAEIKSAAAPQA